MSADASTAEQPRADTIETSPDGQVPSDGPEPIPPGDPRRYLDRQASELEYHARVLHNAADPDRPVLERAKFLAIFTSLTDEFFRVRVAGLMEQRAAGVDHRSRAGHTPQEELSHLFDRYRELAAEQERLVHERFLPDLAAAGIEVLGWGDLDADARDHLSRWFEERVFPILTPLAVGPANPFPFISDLSLSVGVVFGGPQGPDPFARVKVPAQLPRFVPTGDGSERLILVEEVIGAHLDRLFPGREVMGWHTFRVTRNADYTVEDVEVEDLLDVIASEILERRFGHAVRLELDHSVPDDVRALLETELELTPAEVVVRRRPLALDDLWELFGRDRPDLKDSPTKPVDAPAFAAIADTPKALFGRMREGDVLVQHPYEKFATSTQRLIEQAADDPRVLAIKQTIYRTSGDSPVVQAMIRAAQAGKQAVAVVELKARFDEEANIAWANKLEEAGVHVVYGFVEMKTHTKTALIVREDEDGVVRRYAHIGTGNYNPSTAKNYEDIGLFTARDDLTSDLGELFNYLTGHSQQDRFRALQVAPVTLKRRMLELIDEQAHPGGRIIAKANHLSHNEIIDALYGASMAGAEVDLILRTICCLRPGVEGLSDNIRVRSVVGRYLEHSRIYRFGRDPEPGRYLIGSADLMPRNLDRRVEAVTPVDDPKLRQRLDGILDAYLHDDVLSWRLEPDGAWHPVETTAGRDAQREIAALTVGR